MQKRFCVYAFAGAQQEEPLSNSVKALMQKSVSDRAAPKLFFSNEVEAKKWLDTMSERLQKRIPDHNLFHLRLNLRYGCTILRHYLDIEHGDLYRALGRYNGNSGQPQYPTMVVGAWRRYWSYTQ